MATPNHFLVILQTYCSLSPLRGPATMPPGSLATHHHYLHISVSGKRGCGVSGENMKKGG